MAPANGQAVTKVVTGKVRLSYAHLFEAYAPPPKPGENPQTPKYSVVLLIPKSDKATLAKLEAARQAATEAGKTSKWGGKIPKNLKYTLRDGDDEIDTDEKPEYEGMMFMSVSSTTQPGIVDRDVNPILDSTEVYSGCYARVSINAFPYSASGSNGISFGLNHVQKLADGENLGGKSRAEDDFDAVEDEESEDSVI